MSSAIAAASTCLSAASTVSKVALDAQLSRDQVKHADWVACPSGATPEGKRIIQQLEAEMRTIEARLKETTPAGTSSESRSSTTGPGALVDVYA